MDWPDYAIMVTIALSIAVGALRGFIKEVFALAVWIAAFLVAYQFSGMVAAWLEPSISLPSARTALAFGGLFVLVLAVGGLITWLVGKLVEKTGLSGTDRLLGGAFGVLRGILLVVVTLMVAAFTPLPSDPWWHSSGMIQALLPLAEWAAGFLPENISQYLDFYPEVPAPPTEA